MPKDEPPGLPPVAYELDLGGVTVHLLGTVFGLASEGERVQKALEAADPDMVALGVPPEDVEGLGRLAGQPRPGGGEEDEEGSGEVFAADAIGAPGLEGILGASATRAPGWAAPAGAPRDGDEEFYTTKDTRVFLRLLKEHGGVAVPPRELVAVHRWAEAQGRPLHALDLDDEAHSEVFVREVSMFQIMRQNRRLKRIYAQGLAADGPREFAVAWDREVNSGEGFRRVERSREAHMGEALAHIARELSARQAAGGHRLTGRIVAVVPLERSEGVARYLVERSAARIRSTQKA